MKIVVVGCGRAGAELAVRMSRNGHEVTVVDGSGMAFANLPPEFRGRTIQGDALAEGTLAAAGAAQADGLAAVTASDAVNAVVAHAARAIFGVKRVVVRSYAPSRESIHEAFGHHAISSTMWGAQRLEERLEDEVGESEASFGSGEVRVWRVTLPHDAPARALAPRGDGYAIVAVTRDGSTVVPGESVDARGGDVLHVACTPERVGAARRALAGEGRR
jgi:trk system potassium uptake protein TrkA